MFITAFSISEKSESFIDSGKYPAAFKKKLVQFSVCLLENQRSFAVVKLVFPCFSCVVCQCIESYHSPKTRFRVLGKLNTLGLLFGRV